MEIRQKLKEVEKPNIGQTKKIIPKGKGENNKRNLNFLFLFIPIFLCIGYLYYWRLRKTENKPRREVVEGIQPKFIPAAFGPGIANLKQELEKTRQEKQQLETKLAEKENLETRLINQEILEAQLQKVKKDLEETDAAKQLLEDKILLIEKQIEERKDELKTKEELIRQLIQEKEALKIETAKMNMLLKKEVSLREELDNQLTAKSEEIKEILSKDVEPKKEALPEGLETPGLELSALADKGILLRVATANKGEPYLFGVVKNISPKGIIAELNKDLPAKPESLRLSLFEHGSLKPIALTGRVIEQKKDEATTKVRVNITFLSISKDKEKRINDFIKKIETLVKK